MSALPAAVGAVIGAGLAVLSMRSVGPVWTFVGIAVVTVALWALYFLWSRALWPFDRPTSRERCTCPAVIDDRTPLWCGIHNPKPSQP